jgi:sterol desaturase/sphingolipid hydroxylase (fatty acid hydroxylase superfamily)
MEMLLLLDLASYASHRLCHTVPWLWRFHAIHHSTTNMNWLSAARTHPLDDAFRLSLNLLPLFCLGFPIHAAMKLFPLVAFYALFVHSNLALTLRPISYLVTSPVYHRFHHTLRAEGGDKNFAGLFPIFDKIFGTYYLPRTLPVRLGPDHDDVPVDFIGQLAHPFRCPETAPNDVRAADPPLASEPHASVGR